MNNMRLDDAVIDFEVRFAGDPILLIHGAVVADSYEPMIAASPALRDHQVLRYHRRGFGNSTQPDGPRSINDEVDDAVALLDHLAIDRAHVIGHSLAGLIALQLAADAPDTVSSLTLLEPALLTVPAGEVFAAGAGPAAELFDSGDHPGALTAFLTLVGGDDAMSRLSHLPPGATAQAMDDLATLFTSDLNALGSFSIDEAHARRITAPTLLIRGTDSPPVFQQAIELLEQWIPHTSTHVLDGASHFLQMEQPSQAADAITDFLALNG